MIEKTKLSGTLVRARRHGWAIGGTAAGAAVLVALGSVACGAAEDGSSADDGFAEQPQTTLAPRLNPTTVPKFVNQLPRFHTFAPTLIRDSRGKVIRKEYTVRIAKFTDQQLPPPFPKTLLFGYGGNVKVGNCQFTDENPNLDAITTSVESGCTTQFVRSSPGPKFEQTRFVPALVRYRNDLTGAHPLPVDPTLDWANPNNFPKPNPPFLPFPPGYPQAQSPIPHVTHTHGIEVTPEEDGLPDSWFTQNDIRGPEFVTRDYLQPSSNLSAAFWYHDHSFGVTRLDVGMGLSGFSILRDPNSPLDNPRFGQPNVLPRGEFEVQLIVQDRSFRTDGSIFIPIAQQTDPTIPGVVPDVHPYWTLINEGDMNLVNGRVWPNMNVKRALYRFRILNSANQRFYQLKFSNNMSFRVIGSDGGYLRSARTVNDVLLGVTERADILVDFRNFAAGTKIVMQNISQRTPPIGPAPDPNTDGTVMQFTVQDPVVAPPAPLPATLQPIPNLVPDRSRRVLIQNVQTDDQGRILQAELDGQLFHELTTELPTIGSTEDWDFVNVTPLTHNKHVHLIQFLVVQRQNFNRAKYLTDWLAINGNPPFDHPTLKLPIEPYLIPNTVSGPRPEESGWKDTVRTPADQVTRIRIRWAIPDAPLTTDLIGRNTFPINPLNSIGYIWHCHLLEHEDNEMMRPMTVIPIWKSGTSYPVGNRRSPGRQQGLVDFNGINYQSRVAHFSTQSPNQRPDLWERINNRNGEWAIQTIYNVGDRVLFSGRVWRALQRHQARAGQEPTAAPSLWALVTTIPT